MLFCFEVHCVRLDPYGTSRKTCCAVALPNRTAIPAKVCMAIRRQANQSRVHFRMSQVHQLQLQRSAGTPCHFNAAYRNPNSSSSTYSVRALTTSDPTFGTTSPHVPNSAYLGHISTDVGTIKDSPRGGIRIRRVVKSGRKCSSSSLRVRVRLIPNNWCAGRPHLH